MQDRYVGDVGDYVKLAILRALMPGRRLGVAWWMFPDARHNGDGRHTGYLDRPDGWRRFDPQLFDALKRIVHERRRTVRALEDESLLPGAAFADELIPCDARPFSARPGERRLWFERTKQHLEAADLVFLDPDNGIEPRGLRLTCRSAAKSVMISEICALRRPGRVLVVYHHHTRHKGGHAEELGHLAHRLAAAGCQVAGALRARPWSPRAFFLIDADDETVRRAYALSARWDGDITWHDDLVRS
jgi:hypothetical protein